MKTSIINYISIAFLMTVCFIGCDDIVTYDDDYVDETISNGPPVITRVSPVENPDQDTTQGSFNQMIIIHGENLSQVKSILFNDQSADLEEIYAVTSKIVVSIPGTVPDEITNKIVVTTEKGTAEFPFKVAFPDLIIRGFDFDFGNAGETVVLQGENLLLYDLTPEGGDIRMNGISATILSTTENAVTLKIPEGITDNATVSVSSSRIKGVLGEEPIEFTYRDLGFRIVDMGPGFMTNPSSRNFATDGIQEGDPTPLFPGTCFTRIKGTVGGYSTNIPIYNYPFNAPTTNPMFADMRAHPENYEIKYEILIKAEFPITAPGDRIRMVLNGARATNEQEWIPALSGVAFHTHDRWITKSSNFEYYKTASGDSPLFETNNAFTFAYIHGAGTVAPTDLSMTNLRFAKKVNIVRKQL